MSVPAAAALDAGLATAIRAELAARPDAMLLEISRTFQVPEFAVLALIGAPRATLLDATRWEDLMRGLPTLGDVRVLVSNAGATMESHGTFGGFSRTGPYFNVQTASLDLHLRWSAIAGVVAVEKPSHQTGHPTASVQLFDPEGTAILKIFVLFGEHAGASPGRRAAFDDLRAAYALPAKGISRSVDPMP